MVEEEELDSLYQMMVTNGLFTQKWRTLDPHPSAAADNQ
jgi:hypothetical protein